MEKPTYTSKILFVGGGSGGHFYPLIAIAEALNAQGGANHLYYAGPTPYDKESLDAQKISFVSISAGKRRRYFSFLNIIDTFKTIWGIFIAIIKLFILFPDVVMSKGGYTSVPVVLVASFFRIPIVIHESDARMGKANIFASKFARTIITNYPELQVSGTTVQPLGIPIRNVFMTPPRDSAHATFGTSPDTPTILILGGSQGAERVNELVLDSLDELLPEYVVIHQTGTQHFEACKKSAETLITDSALHARYHPFPFLDAPTLNDAYNVAHVVVSRAGSNSIYEIALHARPSILIPIPEEVSHDQRTNAYAYARGGGAVVMEERNLKDSLLRAEIDRIMHDSELYTRMSESARSFARPDTAERIAHILTEIIEEHKR